MDHLKQLLWLAAAGVGGAFVGLSVNPEQRTPIQKVIYVISGMAVAAFLTPIICRRLGLVEAEEISAIAFCAGAFWSGIVDKLGQVFSVAISNVNLKK